MGVIMYRMLILILVSLLAVPLLATVPAAKIRGTVTKTIRASDVKALDAVLAKYGLHVNSILLQKEIRCCIMPSVRDHLRLWNI